MPPAVQALHSFVAQSGYPCVGAKAALARGGIETLLCGPITSSWDDAAITRQLVAFARRWRTRPRLFASFVVIFDRGPPLTERQFEAALWARLQSFTSHDRWLGFDHDLRVSSDPANPDFALSFGGEAFFAIGLHPGASRRSRRFPVAFNCFMNVSVDGESGELAVLPPKSRAGDTIMFRARMDLVVGLTACSAPQSNNHSFKPIDWRVHAASG